MALWLSGFARLSLAVRPAASFAAPLSASKHGVPTVPQHKPFSVGSGLAHDAEVTHLFRVIRNPTVEEGRKAPQSVMELSDEKLYILAEQDDHNACRERLLRNIMAVDGVDYMTASKTLKTVSAANSEQLGLVTLPYKVGIASAAFFGAVSIPMVFHKPTALWFNDLYVKEEVAAEVDLETWLEVGSWTWAWMEPLQGTGCFVILAMQVARNQMLNMGWKPYTGWVRNRRSKALVERFPQYNSHFLRTYSQTAAMSKNDALVDTH